jgi:hypothetical protein
MPESSRLFGDALRFRPVEDLEEIAHGDRMALYRAGMDKAILLNRTGSQLWRHFGAPQSTASLVGYLAARFPTASRDRLEGDVRNYLEHLWRQGIITPLEE